MKSFELADLSVINSTDSLVSLDYSTTGFSALLAAKGWRDLNPEIYAAESADQAKEQHLQKALQNYVLHPDAPHGWELMGILREVQVFLKAEYTYSKKQQALYQAQAEQEAKNSGHLVADWTQWLWRGVQDFMGSSNAALVEKYAQKAADCQDRLASVSAWADVLQQELQTAQMLSKEEEFLSASREQFQVPEAITLTDGELSEEMQFASSRHLLQTTTSAEMTITYCEPSGACLLTGVSDGQVGFSLAGQVGDWSGYSVSSAGDINGDGLDDILVGARSYTPGGKITVVFGSNQPDAWGSGALNLITLADGQRGFALLGQAGEATGFSVSGAGDINGDGLDDILVGSPGYASYSGKTTVVFGSNQSDAWGSGTLNLGTLADGQRGFVLLGQAGDHSGSSVSSAGDINGDGLDDILVGAYGYGSNSGKTTVVFGSNQTGAWGSGMLNLTTFVDGQRGFVLLGQAGDASGYSVSSAGDINGDGLDDILVGAPYASGQAGKITVVFGSNQTDVWGIGTLDLTTFADGQRGFVLLGQAIDQSGYSVSSAGDINGDGLNDILVGAPYTSATTGITTVVFGSNQPGAWGSGTLNFTVLADGQRGFMMQGEATDYSGYSVSSAGDINGDGLDDILIGAPNLIGFTAGKATVVLGSNQSGAWGSGMLNLATLADGQHGFMLLGQVGDYSGWVVNSAGDINGDQLDDILVGSPAYAVYGGKTTVVFGDSSCQVIVNQLRIAVGETVPFNASLLAVFSSTQNNATLVLTPEAVQHGRFESVSVPGVALSSFLFGNITSVQFRQDGSGLSPSYQITLRNTALFHAYSVAQVDFLGYPPILLNNAIYVNQGVATPVVITDLSASDVDTSGSSLLFLFSEVQHAQFNLRDSNGSLIMSNISSCLQQAVFDQQLELAPDGSVIAPSYRVAVTDGLSTISSIAAIVIFNQAPVLTMNPIILDQGQATLIRPQDIGATDDHTLSYDLLFQVTNVTSGDYFEYLSNVGYVLTEFPQFPLSIGNVGYFQNGSSIAPTFSIRASDGKIATPWQTPVIQFNHRPLLQRTLPTYGVEQGDYFSIALGDDLFTDPDGDSLTLSAQQTGGVPLPNGITFDAESAKLNGILETLISLQIQIIAADPRGLTVSTNFTLQSTAPRPGFNFEGLYSALSAIGTTIVTVLGYMWWRRNAASHRIGYEFANMLRKVLNLQYYDFTKGEGELYKTHIERVLTQLKFGHNKFYTTLTTLDQRRSFAVCLAEIIQKKNLLNKASCLMATHNRFFLFSPSWPNRIDLRAFEDQCDQITNEAVAAWRTESSKTGGDPLIYWPYPASAVGKSKITKRSETSEVEVVEMKDLVTEISSSSSGQRETLFPLPIVSNPERTQEQVNSTSSTTSTMTATV